jgi:transcriptional regulator with XRE-family HTH domain
MDELNQSKIEFGLRVKHRRQELGMTMEELAEKMGYKHKTSIQKIECGENSIPQNKIEQLAKCLDTTIQDLMGWTQMDISSDDFASLVYNTILEPLDYILPTEEEIKIIALYRKASDRDKKLILSILNEE